MLLKKERVVLLISLSIFFLSAYPLTGPADKERAANLIGLSILLEMSWRARTLFLAHDHSLLLVYFHSLSL